jgi:hypothetical protein
MQKACMQGEETTEERKRVTYLWVEFDINTFHHRIFTTSFICKADVSTMQDSEGILFDQHDGVTGVVPSRGKTRRNRGAASTEA